MNADVPYFKAFVRERFFYQGDATKSGHIPVVVFGIRSVSPRALGFHVMTERGAMYSPLPIHALCAREDAAEMKLSELELWDCFGEDVEVHEFDFLAERRCRIWMPARDEWLRGSYRFTLDWHSNPWSEEPSEWKCMHLIELDNGNYALQPNNRILWHDGSVIAKPYEDGERPDFKVQNVVWSAESEAELPVADEDLYFYGGDR